MILELRVKELLAPSMSKESEVLQSMLRFRK
jgi:hypothetical protein